MLQIVAILKQGHSKASNGWPYNPPDMFAILYTDFPCKGWLKEIATIMCWKHSVCNMAGYKVFMFQDTWLDLSLTNEKFQL